MKFLKISEVIELTGASRACVYRWERDGKFPQRRQISQSRVGWIEEEIREWMEARPVGLGQESKGDIVMAELAERTSTWSEEEVERFNESAKEARSMNGKPRAQLSEIGQPLTNCAFFLLT